MTAAPRPAPRCCIGSGQGRSRHTAAHARGSVPQGPPRARGLPYHRGIVSFSEITHRHPARSGGRGPWAPTGRAAGHPGAEECPSSPYLISVFSRRAHGASWTGEPHRTLEAVSASWALGPFLALQRREDPWSNRAPSWGCPATTHGPEEEGPMGREPALWGSDPCHGPRGF